jgi:peptidoglycan hydrolase-like protein with peptidoglycan-binding domain
MGLGLRSGLITLIFVTLPVLVPSYAATSDATGSGDQVATPALVREIQFMLLQLGFDPGPIDGNAQQLTNKAVHAFEQHAGLPSSDLVNSGPISAALLAELRKETVKALTKGAPVAAASPAAPAPPDAAPPPATAAVTPPPPPEPPAPPAPAPPQPDRFASCVYDPADFHIGNQQYTPQSFLDEGFGGSTARAVATLHQRLDEARQIADKIGGPALMEVQRQARVVAYFECRQKIEQASATKN